MSEPSPIMPPRPLAVAAITALLVAALLVVVRQVVSYPMLLADRFLPGAGWAEILLVAGYAGWVVTRLLDPAAHPRWRRRIWLLFGVVFFAQLALGLAGFERFLQTGELHLPIPAVIVAGPLYRGEGLFMVILFGVSILLMGPAWCSHLCYFGAFDQLAADRRRKPLPMPRQREWLRVLSLLLVAGTALGLRLFGVATPVAVGLALGFALAGVALIALVSRRRGAMVHCTVWCPLGLVAVVAGKLNPFRIRILPDCTDCGRCTRFCRYDALRPEQIARRRPGLSCTLCGDCIPSCRTGHLAYRFGPISGPRVRATFLVLVVTFHAVSLAVARV